MRYTALVLGALIATGPFIGCSGGGTGPAQGGPPGPTQSAPLSPAISLATSQAALGSGVVSHAINFGQARDLWVRVTMPTIPHVARVHLTFQNPLGELMYESTTAYSMDAEMKEMPMAGKSSPMTILPAMAIPGGFAIDVGLPLAGTTFTRYPTTAVGDWTVKAEVDGIDHPLVTTMSVTFTR